MHINIITLKILLKIIKNVHYILIWVLEWIANIHKWMHTVICLNCTANGLPKLLIKIYRWYKVFRKLIYQVVQILNILLGERRTEAENHVKTNLSLVGGTQFQDLCVVISWLLLLFLVVMTLLSSFVLLMIFES